MGFCEICGSDNATIVFDDSTYAKSRKYPSSPYNLVINPSCYNIISTCYDCLITNVYDCDTTSKYMVLSQIKEWGSTKRIQQWWKQILYNIDTKVGSQFIYKRMSPITKKYMSQY
ncbi:hypothetical protein EB118_11665 [bacterium]|nr:hypothetical protein [bacterium]NDC94897.1 hypothetical protein [bacterium]NDD84635.1 hypothetical protein [bacterium]NDG30716.1 hypothetical protein [bacterium]